eukprot:COSAG02_NODE_62255_length_266_cov_0.766467_1_plen_23_part_01
MGRVAKGSMRGVWAGWCAGQFES